MLGRRVFEGFLAGVAVRFDVVWILGWVLSFSDLVAGRRRFSQALFAAGDGVIWEVSRTTLYADGRPVKRSVKAGEATLDHRWIAGRRYADYEGPFSWKIYVR